MGVPKNLPAFSPDEAVAKANEMPGDEVVVPQLQDDLSRLAEEQQICDDFCIMCIYIYINHIYKIRIYNIRIYNIHGYILCIELYIDIDIIN